MRILGADVPVGPPGASEGTVLLLADDGRVAAVRHPTGLNETAATAIELAGGEPFLLAVGLPIVAPEKASRFRPVERLVRRRLGVRLPPGGRASLDPARRAVGGEALLAALAAAGVPCLPYPDRDRRSSGLAEIHPQLVLKALLWEGSAFARPSQPGAPEALFKALSAPEYRRREKEKASSWAERAGILDLLLRALGPLEGYDFRPAREALVAAASEAEFERACSIFDACLLASTARRYMDRPETCLFFGDRTTGYTILPADPLIRRLALKERATAAGVRLFPSRSLRARLEREAELRPAGLLAFPGRPQKIEASFREPPVYEFDNLDEMVWWKHCRHLAGPEIPTEGLEELVVSLEGVPQSPGSQPLRLVRSRHRTLSFRFDPPAAWRRHISPRDGKTYPFSVRRAVYVAAAEGA